MRHLTEETPAIVSLLSSPEKEKELEVVMMPLEGLVMMPLENTYISFLQKNTCERVLSRRKILCVILMRFVREEGEPEGW